MSSTLKLMTLSFMLLITLSNSGQNNFNNSSEKYKNLPKGTVVYNFMMGDSVSHTRIELPDSVKRYIVEFTEAPLYAGQVPSTLKSASLYNDQRQKIDLQHNQFLRDLSRMTGVNANNLKSTSVSGGTNPLGKEFRKVFNGVSLTADKNLVTQIEQLGYVKKVHPDNMVEAVDDESNHVIKADSVRQKYGATGKGVVIAIIDTGIDSTHQDLNGKVIGGYDFVNNDNNPMDDHGHGTHCAGIAAAKGPGLTGVAPDAKLLAVKVLNEWGSGYDSWIMAGIEYAIDPDGNPLTDDGADIISMSLGAPNGDPNDPMSTAVNNAYRKGVLCVIAAGNNGSLYHTIGTPGCASDALTVGASDKNDYIGYFSSRGPALNSYEIKPNVLAPGVDIYSSLPHGMYESWNGTSMATPHVAGAAALLKEIHPTWNAQKMRSAIVHTAIDRGFNFDVWTQGNGRVDLMKAASVASAVSKNSINFGLIPDSETTYNRVDSFYVHNLSGNRINYLVSINDEFPSEITLNLSPNHFSLAPSDSQLVLFSLNVDNTTLPFPSTPVAAYTGKVIIDDGIQPQNLLFSMIKSYSLTIDFDFEPWCVMIHDNNSIRNYYYPQGSSFSTLLPTGTFDVIVCNLNSFIVRENIDIGQTNKLDISIKEAKNRVEFKGVDPNGNPLKIFDFSPECLVLKNRLPDVFGFNLMKISFWDGYTVPPVVRYFSDFSDKYQYEIGPAAFPHNNEHQWYFIPFLIDYPFNRDTLITNKPTDFVKVNYHINDFGNEIDSIYYTKSIFSYGIGGSYNLYDSFDTLSHILTKPYTLSEYVIPSPNNNYHINRIFGLRLHELDGKINPNEDSLLYSMESIVSYKDSSKVFLSPYYTISPREVKNIIDLNLNLAPIYFNTFVNYEYQSGNFYLRKQGLLFADQASGFKNLKIPFTYSSESKLILQDTIANRDNNNWDNFKLPADLGSNYTLKIYDIKYNINKKEGKASSTFYEFIDSSEPWTNYTSPLSQLQIKSGDNYTNLLNSKENNLLSLTLNTSNYKQVKVLLKSDKMSEWKSCYVYNSVPNIYKNEFEIEIPDTLKSNYYSMKLSLIKTEKDSSIYLFEPAFYVLSDLEADSLALVDLYTATNGEEWGNHSNWLKTRFKNWFGVTVENGRVVAINLPSNNLKGYLPGSIKNLSELRTLTLNSNYLDEVGDLTLLPSLTNVNISNNHLTFNDIIPNLSIESMIYSPQKKIGEEQVFKLIENDRFEMNTFFSEEGCHYFWFKNSRRISNAEEPLITFDAISETDEGSYSCFIMNENVQGLTLETSPFILSVEAPLFIDRSYLLDNLDLYSYGGSWIDFDNDSDQDLFIVNYDGSNQLLKNMFIETDSVWFTDITEIAMGLDNGSSAVSTWGDINNDGFIDVFVVNQKYTDPKIIYLNNGDGTFRELNDPVIQSQLRYSCTANWVDFNRDGLLDLYVGNTYHYQLSNSNNQLFINKGNLTFESYQEQNQCLTSSLDNNAVSWFDLDNDTDMDVFVSGYGVDLLYVNNEGSFKWPNNEDSTWISTGVNGQTNSVGDFDNDGDLDVFSGHGGWYYGYNNDPKNVLFENVNGKLRPFMDNSLIADKTNYFSSSWGDYDNDGDLDLLGTSFYGITNLWTNQLQESGTVSFKKVEYGATVGYLMGSRGCSFADFDNDGDLDIFVDGSQYENHLFENVVGTNYNWINIKCIGDKSNASAIGTKVKIKATINGKPCWQMQEVSSQTGYSGQNSLNVEFGLGNASVIDSVKIYWPSGAFWDTTGVQINQFIEFIEKEKPNDIPQLVAFDDTIVYENVPFVRTYQIIDEWNKGIAISVVKKPSWVKYTIQNQSITFTGTPGDYTPGNYSIILSVSDGYLKSPVIDTIALIVENVNDAPVILGQSPITLDATGRTVLSIDQLMVIDIDNDQEDLFIVILEGEHYTISNNTVIANQQYLGNLTVKVQVSDGVSLSAPYNLTIQSNSNDLPCLSPTCKAFNAKEDILFQSELVIIDEKFSQISIVEKSNLGWISISTLANKITLAGTPGNNNTGLNKLIVEINDGYLTTPVIDTVLIDVQQVNDAPIITGQNQLTVDGKGYIQILLSDLFVEDVDNVYPVGFELLIHPGTGYSIAADTVFLQKNDKVFVPVQVNDGQLSSNVFNLEIENFTAIDDVISSDWTIYPIPFYNDIFVKSPALASLVDIEIFDLQGKRMYPPIVSNERYVKVDCSGLTQSVYLLRLTTTNSTMVKKLIRGK